MAQPAAIPLEDYFMEEHTPALVPRQASSTTTEKATVTSCGPKDTTGPCERPVTGSSLTMPIVVGTVVPIAIAIVVMIFLHRRHVRNQRKEDAEDKHGSLDFGMGEGRRPKVQKSRWKKQPPPPPQMTMAEAKSALRSDRGLSIDLGNNPYLLPAGLANSRESLHSMSRSANRGDDKYQRTNFIPDDGSIRSPSVRRMHGEDSSSFSGSTRYRNDAESSRSLIHGGAPRPAPPPKAFSPVPFDRTTSPAPTNLLAPSAPDARESMVSNNGNTAAFRASNNYLSSFIRGGAATGVKEEEKKPAVMRITEAEVVPTPERELRAQAALPAIVMNEPPLEFGRLSEYSEKAAMEEAPQRPARTTSKPLDREPQMPHFSVMDYDSQGTTAKESRETSQYGNTQPTSQEQSRAASSYNAYDPSSTQHSRQESQQYQQSSTQHSRQESQQYQQSSTQHSRQESQEYQQYQQYDNEDDYYDPEDTYSVYDEYEAEHPDQRRMTWGMRPLPPDDPSENPEQRANRIRSFYKEYFDESGKPGGGNVAQYYDGSEEYYDDYYEPEYNPPRGMSAMGGRNRAMSNGSYSYGPRAYSSASGQYGYGRPPPRRMPPKKKQMPMPKALNVLPTPSALKDDTFLLDMAVDFAPPDRAKMQRSGTPNSRRAGEQRSYSPSVRAFTPLQSSYDDLAMLPSP